MLSRVEVGGARSVKVTLQEQAKALGDPTRHAIFRYVADAQRPVDVAELTDYLGLNHNAIRQHLAKLVDADLVTEDRAPSAGRGRPRLIYRLHPTADSRWGAAGPYERLSVFLAEMVRTGDDPETVGRRAARTLLGETDKHADPLGQIVAAMERQGFDPVVRARGNRVEAVLQACPFATTALADPDTVCAFHLGLARGVAELTGGKVVVDDLIRKDPRRANCRLRMHVEPDAEA